MLWKLIVTPDETFACQVAARSDRDFGLEVQTQACTMA